MNMSTMITFNFKLKENPTKKEKGTYKQFIDFLEDVYYDCDNFFCDNEEGVEFYIEFPEKYREAMNQIEEKLKDMHINYDCSVPQYDTSIVRKKYRDGVMHERTIQTDYDEPCVTVNKLDKLIRESKSDEEIVKALKACIQEDIAFDSL